MSGLERHAVSLLSALAARAPGGLVVFTRPDPPAALAALPVEQRRAPVSGRVAMEQLWLPAAAARAGVQLLHMVSFPTPPLWRGRSVVTVHDATPWLFPD